MAAVTEPPTEAPPSPRPSGRPSASPSSARGPRRSRPAPCRRSPRRAVAADRGRATRPTRRTATSRRNLAMKLARPYRMAPLAIATALAAELTREAADAPGRTPIARAEVAAPGLPEPPPGRSTPSRRLVDGILADAAMRGAASSADRAAGRQRRVRVRQSDRAAPHRQRARRLRRRPALPRARGGRPARDARVLLQRLRRPDPEPRRVGRGAPARRAGAGGRLPGRLRRRDRRRAARRRLGGGDDRATPTRSGSSGTGRLGRVRAGIEASLEALGVHFDVWTSEARLHDEGWVDRAVERLRERGHVYEQDGARLVPLDDVRRRQGPGHLPLDRRADVLRGRHRLRHREVQPRLRPPHLHLGRRPPRDGGAASGTPPRRWATTATPSR